MLAGSYCSDGRRQPPLPQGPVVDHYVVFLEADFRLNDASQGRECYADKLGRLSATVQPIFDTLFKRVLAAKRSGKQVSVEVFAVNQVRHLLSTSNDWLPATGLRYPAEIDAARDHARRVLLDSLKSVLSTSGGYRFHDLLNTIAYLRGKTASLFDPKTVNRTVVIYVDDLVHYNAGTDTDASRGLFNLSDTFSLRRFTANVDSGWAPTRRDRLSNIAGAVPFAVFSIPLVRCPDEPWPGGVTPNFDALSEPVQHVWEQVFRNLGAEPVGLGLNSAEDVFRSVAASEPRRQ